MRTIFIIFGATFIVRVVPRLFPYSASKSSMLKYILPNIPEHSVYIEPLAGSGTVFFNKKPAKSEILNDRNDLIVTVYRVVQDEAKFRKFARMMYYMTHSDSEFRRSAEILINRDYQDEVTVAYAVCVRVLLDFMHELNTNEKNCIVNLINKKTIWTTERFLRDLLPFLHQRLQNAQILNRDALQVIKDFDRKEAFMFLDPPYLNTSTELCDMHNSNETASESFHRNLLNLVKSCKSKIMITSYQNELYEEELKSWNKLRVLRPSKLRYVRSKAKNAEKEVCEVIYMNYEPPSSAALTDEAIGMVFV